MFQIFTLNTESFEPSHDKTNKMTVHPAKTQISLFAVCSVGS